MTGFVNGRRDLDELRHQIERLAKCLDGNPDSTLTGAIGTVMLFVCRYAPDRIGDPGIAGASFHDLYVRMKDARDDHAHTGTPVVQASRWTKAVGAVLLEALEAAACNERDLAVRDVMVTNPACAHDWQTLADLRRTMLVNDYSVLPIDEGQCRDGTWCCVGADELAQCLRGGRRRKRTLAEMRLANATDIIRKANAIQEDTPIGDVLGKLKLPVVVTKDAEKSELVGIVTAFDLL